MLLFHLGDRVFVIDWVLIRAGLHFRPVLALAPTIFIAPMPPIVLSTSLVPAAPTTALLAVRPERPTVAEAHAAHALGVALLPLVAAGLALGRTAARRDEFGGGSG